MIFRLGFIVGAGDSCPYAQMFFPSNTKKATKMKFHVISTISHELLGKIAKGSHDTQEVSDRTGVDEQDIVGIVESLVRADMAMTEEDHLAIQKATQEAEAAQKKKMEVQP